MKAFRLLVGFLVVGLVLVVAPMSRAIDDTLTVGTTTYHVTTNTLKGSCLTRIGLDLTVYLTCFDGDNEASASSADGCGNVVRLGHCYTTEQNPEPDATSQVDCNNSSYTVTTGDDSGSCTGTGSGGDRSMSCTSAENANTASADCANGCGNTTGSGCCCETGTCGDTCFS